MVTFIIIRHGHSEFNKEFKYTGQYDAALTEDGIEQANLTAKYLFENYKVDKIYSSDLSRALDTAKPISELFDIPVIPRKDLREVHVGTWEGKRYSEIKETEPELFALLKSSPGETNYPEGENYAQVQKRMLNALEEIAKENDSKTVVITTHGGALRCLQCAFTDTPISYVNTIETVSNNSLTVVNFSENKGEIVLLGYCEHLLGKSTKEKPFA